MVESLYSKLHNPQVVAKQRFVERFDGDALDERWTLIETGSGTSQMSDGVDQGYEYITGTTSADRGAITFNVIRPFDDDAAVFIIVCQKVTATSNFSDYGFYGILSTGRNYSIVQNVDSVGFYRVATDDGSSASQTNYSDANDETKRLHRGELNGTNFRTWMDGILKVTKTSDLPTIGLEAFWRSRTAAAAAKTSRIMYFEAYNT